MIHMINKGRSPDLRHVTGIPESTRIDCYERLKLNPFRNHDFEDTQARGTFLQECSSRRVLRATSCRMSPRFKSSETKRCVRQFVDRTPCRTHIFLSLVVSRMSEHIQPSHAHASGSRLEMCTGVVFMFHGTLLGVLDTFSPFCSSLPQTTPTSRPLTGIRSTPCATSLDGVQSGHLAEPLPHTQLVPSTTSCRKCTRQMFTSSRFCSMSGKVGDERARNQVHQKMERSSRVLQGHRK